MKTKKKLALIIGTGVVTVLALLFCLLYFVCQVSWLDRGGWHKTESNALQYWDYYGRPLKSWQDIDGKRYYFNPASGNMYTGWLQVQQNLYYLDAEGVLYTGWLDTGSGRYYLDESGVRHTGWLRTEEGLYFLNDIGILQTGWLTEAGRQYYLAENGAAVTGWQTVKDKRYFFDEEGVMQTGWLDLQDGRYYLDADGTMCTGWVKTPEGSFYLNAQGVLQTKWVDVDGKRYYLDVEGEPVRGWHTIDGVKYYFDSAGVLQTGWIADETGRYYLREDGSPVTGFVEIGGVERYFTETGAYIPLVNPWNPVPEEFALDLVYLEGFQVDATCRDPLLAMLKACRADGYYCVLNSTYRGIATQQAIWNNRYNNYIRQGLDPEEAKRLTWQVVAYPGTSEHHLGLAVDITGSDAMYQWLANHSWEYGFILRYPEEKIDVTGIIYEPWHFRYVGKALAEAVYHSGLCLEEYLQMLKTENATG